MKTADLTKRQRQVLIRLAIGETNKEIAGNLGLSEKTVEFHRAQLKERTGCATIAALTHYAIRAKLCRL